MQAFREAERMTEIGDYVTVAMQNRGLTAASMAAVARLTVARPADTIHKALAIRRGDASVTRHADAKKKDLKNTGGVVTLYGEFEPHEQATLIKVYSGELTVNFLPGGDNSHKMAAAVKKADHCLVMSCLKSCSRVIDLGGNIIWHSKNNTRNVHCCCPVLSTRDATRRIARELHMRQEVDRYASTWFGGPKKVVEDVNKVMCDKDAFTCTAQAEALVMFHVYDIHVDQLADIMERHGSNYLFGTMMMPMDRVWRQKGTIPIINARYKRVGENIKFGFVNDSSLEYVHSAKTLESYTHDAVLTSAKGTHFVYQICQIKPHGITFRVTRCLGKIDDYYLNMKTTVRCTDGMTMRIKTYDFNVFGTDDSVLVPRYFDCPLTTFNLVLGKALAMTDEKFEKRNIDAEVRNYNVGFAANGVPLLAQERLSPRDVPALGLVIYLLALKKRKAMFDIASLFVEQQRELRVFSNAGVVEKLGSTVKAWWKRQMNRFAASGQYLQDIENSIMQPKDVEAILLDSLGAVDTNVFISSGLLPYEWNEYNKNNEVDYDEIVNLITEDVDWDNLYTDAGCTSDPFALDGEKDGDEPGDDETLEAEGCKETRNRSDSDSDTFHSLPDDDVMSLGELPNGDPVSNNSVVIVPDPGIIVRPYEDEYMDGTLETLSTLAKMERDKVENEIDNEVFIKSWASTVSEDMKQERDLRAVSEWISYLQNEMDGKLTQASVACSHLLSGEVVDEQKLKDWKYNSAPKILTLRATSIPGRGTREYKMLPERSGSYMLGYDFQKQKFVTSTDHRVNGQVVAQSWPASVNRLFVCDDFEVWLYPQKLSRARAILASAKYHNLRMPHVTFHVGVPGAGKTRECQNLCRRQKAEGKAFAVALRSKSARKSLATHMVAEGYGVLDKDSVTDLVRTSDSFMLNFYKKEKGKRYKVRSVDVFHLDEALMMHYGEVVVLCLMSGAKQVHMYGDPRQIGFVKRILYDTFYEKCFRPDAIYLMPVSTRCSPQNIAAISSAYGGKIYSSRSIADGRPPTFVPIGSVADIPKEAETLYICPYKDDVKVLKTAGYQNVVTPEQCQGDTVENVILVQLQMSTKNMYDTSEFMVVAFSRCTGHLRYYCVDHDRPSLARKFIDDGNNAEKIRAAVYDASVHGPMIVRTEGLNLFDMF